MSNVVLKVESISKQYRLGQLGTGTVSHDLNRFWARIRGKEDPYLKLGDVNDRTRITDSEYVWSLRDINFEVKQGEVLGIIGKNGAGKSTLLKILSQVTMPTTGKVKVKGHIAALLEVGTGFHPDLTGRENIFLNGAILGMTKAEIKGRLDEIVDFSGVAKYIDTPVKRYSSGMMVRLGFAVAAYLEPEILIVDEVLAVGDAEFQEKCLGKMKDVSGQGRTILFVSHNMSAIRNLCNKGLLLKHGCVDYSGDISQTISQYSSIRNQVDTDLSKIKNRSGIGDLKFTKIEIIQGQPLIKSGEVTEIVLYYETQINDLNENYDFAIGIWNSLGAPMFMLSNLYLNKKIQVTRGNGKIKFIIDKLSLNAGEYTINLLISMRDVYVDFIENAYSFRVEDGNYYGNSAFYLESYDGFYQQFNVVNE